MEYLQIENDFVAIILIILAVLIPITIVFWTLRRMRKKRQTPQEEPKQFGKKFQSVKEERLKQSNKNNEQAGH
jgi:ATP-dependent Zn protease